MKNEILKLRRKIAAVHGRKGFAFDTDKITFEEFDETVRMSGRKLALSIASYFDFLDSYRYLRFKLLVHTDQGIFRFIDCVRVVIIEDMEIVIRFKPLVSLQETMILDYKIIDPSGNCCNTAPEKKMPLKINSTDCVTITFPIKLKV